MISYRISDDIPPNENFEYGYPISNSLIQSPLKLGRYKPHKAACQPMKCDAINDVKLFLAVFHRINCRKYLTLTNQTSRYKCKSIRIFSSNLNMCFGCSKEPAF